MGVVFKVAVLHKTKVFSNHMREITYKGEIASHKFSSFGQCIRENKIRYEHDKYLKVDFALPAERNRRENQTHCLFMYLFISCTHKRALKNRRGRNS